MKTFFCGLLLIVAMMTSSCSIYTTKITQAEGMSLRGMRTFRINYTVHDDQGKDIDEEIIAKQLDRWMEFTQMCDRVKLAFQEKGYIWKYAPGEKTDFIVDISFSAFYSNTIPEEELLNQPNATFIVGKQHEDYFTHVVYLTVLAAAPQRNTDEFVILWEGRGLCDDTVTITDINGVAFPLMVELLLDFPMAAK